MKIKEIFEYEVNAKDVDDVFTIQDYIECMNNVDLTLEKPNIVYKSLEIIEK